MPLPRALVGALLLLALFVGALAASTQAVQAQDRGPIYTVEVRGTVSSATVAYLRRALQTAESANAAALIITLHSEGGVLRDVRPFADSIASSLVPVVVFVAPSGTDAGPSGTLLLSAAHLNALAPGTTFGSPYPLAQIDETLSQQTQDLVLDSVVDQLRQWNGERGRNTEWIERAVRDGAILSNEQAAAFTPPAIDLVASDLSQLLALLEGRSVRLISGQDVVLSTLGQSTVPIAPTLWESLRLALAEPTLAFALLVVGALMIYLELAAPGTAIFAGAGVVLILGSLVGLLSLPIQGWALALLLVSLLLLGGEFFLSVHGALAVIGLGLMIVSGLNLIDPAQAPGTQVALWAIIGIALGIGVLVAFGVALAVRVRARPVVTGQEGMIGKIAEVRQALAPEGMVYVEGALWRAITEDGDAPVGERVRVVAMHNLQLVVKRIE